MNPFRLDVLGVAILLSAPVLGLGATGGLTADEAVVRFLICWAASTVGIWLVNQQLAASRAEADRLARLRAELDALTREEEEAAANADSPDGDGDPTFGEMLAQNSAGDSTDSLSDSGKEPDPAS